MARQNQFEVEIRCPQIGLFMRGLRVKTAALPGKSFETTPFGEIPSGAKKQYPTSVTYPQDVTLTFILDSTMEDKIKMELWQESMYGDDYSIRYPDNYEGEIKIKQLDRGGNQIYEAILHKAYPQAISNSILDMESSAVQTFDVTFAYRTWSSDYTQMPKGLFGSILDRAKRKLISRGRRKIEDEIFDKLRTGGIVGGFNKAVDKLINKL
jgi:hypothetical protein